MSIEIVKEYIQLLLKEWDMGDVTEAELLEVWLKAHRSAPLMIEDVKHDDVKVEPEHTFASLKGLKKPQLQDICKSKGMNPKGTKQMLMERILGIKVEPVKPKTTKQPTISQVLRNLHQGTDNVCIRRNLYNRYEHADTKFVFDEVTKDVIGKQLDDGNVAPLTAADIEVCQQYNFPYQLPNNLN